MNKDEVLAHYRATGALLEGHFILSSGLRSPMYLQSARVLMHPERAEAFGRALAARVVATLGRDPVDVVISPAMGGLIIGHEVGRALGKPAMFTERVDGVFTLRRGFALEPGARVLVVEDVVTTGKSTKECAAAIADHGGQVVAACSIIDRTDGEVDLGLPYFSLCGLKVPAYDADNLPPDLQEIPAIKPGSRGLK